MLHRIGWLVLGCSVVTAGVGSALSFGQESKGQESGGAGAPDQKPSSATLPPAPDQPIDGVEPGKVSSRQTERGLKVISNQPGSRYALEIAGKEFKLQHPERLVWSVDDKVIQVLAVPLDDKADFSDPKALLKAHQAYESEFIGQGGWKEIPEATKWLEFPAGEPALYWEMNHPEPKEESDSRADKHLFCTTMNGKSIILISVSVFPGMKEQECSKWLQETMLSVVRYEPAASENSSAAGAESSAGNGAESKPKLYPADASALLYNSDLATARDRKEASAIVVEPQYLLAVLRLALVLEKNPIVMTELTDGQSSHMVNFEGYDEQSGRFLYWEPRGQGSFLAEGNNVAGVKAEPHPEKRKYFYVKEDELATVVRAIITEAQYYRLLGATGDLKQAIQEYDALHKEWPEAAETSQDRLLEAGRTLIDMDQLARGQNCFAVCYHLYPKSARALAGIGEVFVKAKESESAANFYRSAIEQLPGDDSLDAERRASLSKEWQAALDKLPAGKSE
ncbi:MAG: hypothetical protein U0795_06375 [Pirellulales bacterium]